MENNSIFGNLPKFKSGGKATNPREKKYKTTTPTGHGSNAVFIGRMFQVRDITHLFHLKSTSYAEHMALGSFYDGLLGFTDIIAEAFQSESLLDIDIPASKLSGSPIDIISEFRSEALAFKSKCDAWPEIQNVLDEVAGLCAGTIYKLKFLR